MRQYHAQRLPNGYTRVVDRSSGLSSLYYPNGSRRHGDLTGRVPGLIAGTVGDYPSGYAV